MIKSYESIHAEYAKFGAGEYDFMAAAENAAQCLQDEHGFQAVTREAIEFGGQFNGQYLELIESSLEGVRSNQGFGRA